MNRKIKQNSFTYSQPHWIKSLTLTLSALQIGQKMVNVIPFDYTALAPLRQLVQQNEHCNSNEANAICVRAQKFINLLCNNPLQQPSQNKFHSINNVSRQYILQSNKTNQNSNTLNVIFQKKSKLVQKNQKNKNKYIEILRSQYQRDNQFDYSNTKAQIQINIKPIKNKQLYLKHQNNYNQYIQQAKQSRKAKETLTKKTQKPINIESRIYEEQKQKNKQINIFFQNQSEQITPISYSQIPEQIKRKSQQTMQTIFDFESSIGSNNSYSSVQTTHTVDSSALSKAICKGFKIDQEQITQEQPWECEEEQIQDQLKKINNQLQRRLTSLTPNTSIKQIVPTSEIQSRQTKTIRISLTPTKKGKSKSPVQNKSSFVRKSPQIMKQKHKFEWQSMIQPQRSPQRPRPLLSVAIKRKLHI